MRKGGCAKQLPSSKMKSRINEVPNSLAGLEGSSSVDMVDDQKWGPQHHVGEKILRQSILGTAAIRLDKCA